MQARIRSYRIHGHRQIAWINGKKWEDHMRDEEEGSHEAGKRRMTGSKTVITEHQPAVHQLTTCCTSRKKPLVTPRVAKNFAHFIGACLIFAAAASGGKASSYTTCM
jgi:hypothetical protein